MNYRKTNNLVARRIAGETMLIPLRGHVADLQKIYVVEGAGVFLWDLLEQPRSRDELVERILVKFQVQADTAGADVDAFLASMLKQGVVEEVRTDELP